MYMCLRVFISTLDAYQALELHTNRVIAIIFKPYAHVSLLTTVALLC